VNSQKAYDGERPFEWQLDFFVSPSSCLRWLVCEGLVRTEGHQLPYVLLQHALQQATAVQEA